ncbi:MAG: GNAT family N-acetyltransferase [Rhodobacteraceae bacterium]|nr:GNAT family N-acetyltransferase [Paracoccaceae bacterium]
MTRRIEALEASWPAAATHVAGGWRVRDGQGGGKRVSAATAAEEDRALTTLDVAEAAQARLGQAEVFFLTPDQQALDAALAARGYRLNDALLWYEAPLARLTEAAPERLSTFPIWPPLAIMTEIWEAGQIGPARLAVMERARGPKTSLLGRTGDRAVGAAFVALAGDLAMVHALHVEPAQRRQGQARNLMRAAAHWAAAEGAARLALVVRADNQPACALYDSLGMAASAYGHYRVK